MRISREPTGNLTAFDIIRTISQDDFGFLTCLTLLVLTVPACSRVPSIVSCGVRGSQSSCSQERLGLLMAFNVLSKTT